MNRHYQILLFSILFLSNICLFAQPVADPILESSREESLWKGFNRYDFKYKQRDARLIVSNNPLPGNPWIWRARFPDWHTEADSILVSEGFHLAYINTNNKYGSPNAIDIWDDFYEFLITEYKLQKKVALMVLAEAVCLSIIGQRKIRTKLHVFMQKLRFVILKAGPQDLAKAEVVKRIGID